MAEYTKFVLGNRELANSQRHKLRGYLYGLLGNYDHAAGSYLKMVRNFLAAQEQFETTRRWNALSRGDDIGI